MTRLPVHLSGVAVPTTSDALRARRQAQPRTAPLSVAVFSDVLPGRNGVATYYDDLCDHLRERLERLVLLAPAPEQSRLPRSIPLPGDATQRLYLPSLRTIRAEMRRTAPQVIVCATPGPYGLLGTRFAARTGAGLCVGLHTRFDDLASLYWNRWLGRPLQRLLRLWDNAMFRNAGAVLVHNDELLARARDEGVPNLRLIGTPTPKIFLSKPLIVTRPEMAAVSFIGRLAPEKRLDQVLDAAVRHPDILFRIAGDGPLRAEVEGWSRRYANVRALGWIDRAGVLDVLDASDLLVLPSRYETFGTIALEALARATPALVSRHCGINTWPRVSEGLFTMSEGESVADAIERIRRQGPEERRERARKGRAAAESLTRRTIDDWLDVLEEISGVIRQR